MRRAIMLVFALAAAAPPLAAQQDTARARIPAPAADTLRPAADTPRTRADSVALGGGRGDSVRPRPPITPGGAFLRSLIIPGWGQARLNRNFTAGIFVAFEGIAATMVWKSTWQLNFAKARGKYVKSHTQEQQDWIVLLVFNHFFAGAEAFVSANLWDFPVGLEARVLPDGSTGFGVRIPWP
jgi:hypothetical protein